MKHIENITDLFDKFTTLKSKTKVQDKLDTLDAYASDSDFCFFIEYLLNDDKISGLRSGKINKTIKNTLKLQNIEHDNIKSLIEYLLTNNTGSDQEIFVTQNTLNKITDVYERKFVVDIITKEFKCGVTDLTAYGHIPGLQRNWRERKGHSFVDNKTGEMKTKKILDKTITVTLKLDGYRYKIIKKDDNINIYTASGKLDNNLTDIIEEAKLLPDGVYDGEMIASGDFKESTARFNATTKILGRDDEKKNIDFVCFDYVRDVDAFLNFEEYKVPRHQRLSELREILNKTKGLKHIQLVHVYYNNHKVTEETIKIIIKAYQIAISKGEEGLIIDLADASYIRAKGTSMFKMKPEISGDFKVIDIVEGKGKDKGRLGAFIIEYRENTVNVGSGLTDAIREEVWQNKDKYIGKLIEVVYFGETQDEDGNFSLRLPRFKRFRHDKKDISYD